MGTQNTGGEVKQSLLYASRNCHFSILTQQWRRDSTVEQFTTEGITWQYL
jgi:hypothetical protein